MKIVPYKPEGMPLQVALVEADEGVDLVFVDAGGNHEDAILSLSAAGIEQYEDVSEGYGLPLDAKGCVKLVGEPAPEPEKKPATSKCGLQRIIERVNRAIVQDVDYEDDYTLDDVATGDRTNVTVGDLRKLVAALEARL